MARKPTKLVRHQDLRKALKKPGIKGKREDAPKRYAKPIVSDRDALKERFITEYLRDFNAAAAYARAMGPEELEARGLVWKSCQNEGWKMKQDPHVARVIADTIQAMEEEQLITRKEIIAGLKREAHYDGYDSQHGARVTAWSQLGKFLGMDTRRVEVNLASQGGILVVPATQSADEWEKRATEAQAALKKDVRK